MVCLFWVVIVCFVFDCVMKEINVFFVSFLFGKIWIWIFFGVICKKLNVNL